MVDWGGDPLWYELTPYSSQLLSYNLYATYNACTRMCSRRQLGVAMPKAALFSVCIALICVNREAAVQSIVLCAV